jgi:hypothetical protein
VPRQVQFVNSRVPSPRLLWCNLDNPMGRIDVVRMVARPLQPFCRVAFRINRTIFCLSIGHCLSIGSDRLGACPCRDIVIQSSDSLFDLTSPP